MQVLIVKKDKNYKYHSVPDARRSFLYANTINAINKIIVIYLKWNLYNEILKPILQLRTPWFG